MGLFFLAHYDLKKCPKYRTLGFKDYKMQKLLGSLEDIYVRYVLTITSYLTSEFRAAELLGTQNQNTCDVNN